MMHKLTWVIAGLLLMFGLSCKESKELNSSTANQVVPAELVSKTDTFPAKSRLVITFFSVASGVDFQSILRFEDSIGEYAGELGINIDYEKTHWGREGETDFCLELKELSSDQQTEFINRTIELLKTAEHVNIYENAECKHRRPR